MYTMGGNSVTHCRMTSHGVPLQWQHQRTMGTRACTGWLCNRIVDCGAGLTCTAAAQDPATHVETAAVALMAPAASERF
jgi:hypothetical protein